MRIGVAAFLGVLGCPTLLAAQTPASPNSHPLYVELRNLAPGAEGVQVTDLELRKDAATFTLSGTVHLLPAVNGRVTGAVFIGQGSMKYEPPIAVERSMLRHLTKGEPFEETFERAVFRFTDDTAASIQAAGTTGPAPGSANQARDALQDTNQALRLQLKDNLHARILHDVLSPGPGGLFHAYIAGRKYSNRMAYMMDPQGAGFVAPEEVQLFSWANNREGIFAAHHYSSFYARKQRLPTTPGAWIDIEHPKEPEIFGKYWKAMLDLITQKNAQGFRPNDVGPLTQGYRLDSGRTGSVTSSVIYPKGAYVLHMLRMMMWSRDQGDAAFKAMLRDFIATHRNRPVTTEDFKDAVEKHMLPEMNLDGNGTMNWFFRQYVYGTALPTYKLEQSVANKEGQTILSLKITQSGVSDGFKMLLPLYVELTDGRIVRLGAATMEGNRTVEQQIPLGQIPVKRALLNHYYDVLALEEK